MRLLREVLGVRGLKRLAIASALTANLVASLVGPSVPAAMASSVTVPSGYYLNIGDSDFLQVFSVAQTRWLDQNLGWFSTHNGSVTICDYLRVGRLSKICTFYKSVNAVRWLQVRWFMHNAAIRGACGLWIIDDAYWRSPLVKPAEGPAAGVTIAIAWISVGRTQLVTNEHISGSVYAKCTG